MNPILLPIISSIGAFTMIVLLRYISMQEKKMLAEKGVDLKTLAMEQSHRRRGDLRLPFLLIGLALGLLLGNILTTTTSLENVVCYFSMTFLLGGLGLVLAYFYHKREEEKENK